MQDRDRRDIVGGLLLAAIGIVAGLYALANYRMGTVNRMGPGMVPVTIGALLGLFGLWIAAAGWSRRQPLAPGAEVRLYVPAVIAASILAFALMISRFGLVPSVFVSSLLASFAEARVDLLRSTILSVALCGLCWLIFILGLRLTIPAIDWPF